MDYTELDDFCKKIDLFVKDLKSNTALHLSQKKREQSEHLANIWFDNFYNKINHAPVDEDLIKKINDAFAEIIKLSRKPNRISSFQNKFEIIYPALFQDIYLVLKTNPAKKNVFQFSEYLSKLNIEENAYLKEAIDCCNAGYLKAAIVLGWCATVDRIHKKIEEIGFDKFNSTSLNMKNQIDGRFRRYNKSYSINSLSEARAVFDSDLLWVIEGMGLIDINQHTRLSSCFDMRCHSGHPGEAPITEYNTLSFFSDIFEIVLINSAFAIPTEGIST